MVVCFHLLTNYATNLGISAELAKEKLKKTKTTPFFLLIKDIFCTFV